MALLDFNKHRNGIQSGGPLDYCEICANKNNRIDYGALEYKEVFKAYRNSTSTCFCMDHFKSMLDHYLLLDINLEDDEEVVEEKEEEKKEKEVKKEEEKKEKKKK